MKTKMQHENEDGVEEEGDDWGIDEEKGRTEEYGEEWEEVEDTGKEGRKCKTKKKTKRRKRWHWGRWKNVKKCARSKAVLLGSQQILG